MNAPDIKCPYCGGHMQAGTGYVWGTVLGFLAFGFSHQHFWFRAGDQKEVIIASNGERDGHRCTRCGAVAVVGNQCGERRKVP